MVVTEERFIFALGAGGNSRKVQWCDKENNTVWTPSATNEAGDIELATAGQIMQGIRSRGVTLTPDNRYRCPRCSVHSATLRLLISTYWNALRCSI